jgi:hypothetical protein
VVEIQFYFVTPTFILPPSPLNGSGIFDKGEEEFQDAQSGF